MSPISSELAASPSLPPSHLPVLPSSQVRGSRPGIGRPTAVFAVRWDGFVDGESDIATYSYCVGSAALTCDLVPLTGLIGRLANNTLLQAALSEPLGHEGRYCVSIEATNGVGLVSERVSSDCVTIDASPPESTHPFRRANLGPRMSSVHRPLSHAYMAYIWHICLPLSPPSRSLVFGSSPPAMGSAARAGRPRHCDSHGRADECCGRLRSGRGGG